MKLYKKNTFTLVVTLISLVAISFVLGSFVNPRCANAETTEIISLGDSKKSASSKVELTGDSKKETLKVTVKKTQSDGRRVVNFNVNGKNALTLKAYYNGISVKHIELSKKQKFIWIRFTSDNDYCEYDRIYKYDKKTGKFKKVLSLCSETLPGGTVNVETTKIEVKNSKLVVSYSGMMMATGRITWKYTYEYENGKFNLNVTWATPKSSTMKNNIFKTNKHLNLYTDVGYDEVAFSVNKGAQLKLTEILLYDGEFYLKFSYKGQTGLIKAEESEVFKDVIIAG